MKYEIYQSHLGGGIYWEEPGYIPEICDTCSNFDLYLGSVRSKRELTKLLTEEGYCTEDIIELQNSIPWDK